CVRLCHEALSKVRNSQMNLGMHIFGELPEGDRRTEFINSIMRYDSGHGSIRDLIANIMDLDLNDLYASQGDINDKFNISNGALIEDIGNKTRDFIGCILNGKDADGAFSDIGLSPNRLQSDEMVKYIDTIEEIDSRVNRSLEIESFLNALDGHYTPPGPSGVITRGGADILPTGRNFYSLDPFSVPTRAAWRVGIMLANSLLKKYSEETDKIPENVAFFWMSGDIMSAGGEMMAQIMYLLGVRPIYDLAGHVKKFDIIPLSELNRPRIDVTVRTSGILRDMFINCIDLIDSAVNAVSELDEPLDMNYVKKHTLDSIKNGTASVDATARLFSAPPGSYVSGVNLAVYASSWKTEEDLAKIYIATNGYAYGNGRNGEAKHEQFAEDLATVSITYNKIHSDEHDLLGCCCYFSNQGGLTAASKYLSGKDVKSYFGDTREPKDVNVHTLADELRRTVRTKLLNPAWIEGMKEHGYKGASDIMKRVGRVYGWEASTQVVDDWVFDDIASKFVNDDEMREFFKENNPYALEEITRRLLEAEQRELWNADEQTLNALHNNYIEIESWLEDLAGEGEFQGGSVDIITSDEVENWNNNIAPIINSIHKHKPNN
ncbi:MAG: cobaltochelatase subunit CobN, partial [Candidatus Methanomethylophilaceae archaeon]|nr:cobaltochelatase subunit CobN [Candidatus Methanomethylophilaceae archaeon]